ncbi:MAG: hypothetical protein NVS4B5_19390 [Vulcanimicrobiaceae bacterium]
MVSRAADARRSRRAAHRRGAGALAGGTRARRAASLAAYYSKASASEKVSVDYTERKHVRRQQNAPPGLVWYTNARTLLVAPAGVS